jgi:pre-rRNA-processing protein TSR4
LWLDKEHLPNQFDANFDLLQCGNCNKSMVLLLQIYAPLTSDDSKTLEDADQCFHRILYIFCCRNGKCHHTSHVTQTQNNNNNNNNSEQAKEILSSRIISGVSNCFVVLRSQLSELNNCYKSNLTKEGDEQWVLNTEVKKSNTCEICGLFASKRCSACGIVYYCSREHQLLDWNLGHEKQCKIMKSNANYGKLPEKRKSYLCFKEMELVTEPEILTKQQQIDIQKEERKLQMEKEKTSLVSHSKFEEPEQFERVEKDAAFLRFQKKVSPFSDQVIRYYNKRNRKTKQLSISNEGQISDFPNMPPKCERCGAERELEFQVCVCVYVCMCVCICVCLFISLFVCLFVCLFCLLFVQLSFCPFYVYICIYSHNPFLLFRFCHNCYII